MTKPAVTQDRDPVGQPYGLVDVVGDQEDGGPVPEAQLTDERLHLQPGQCVERGERLVQQQEFGLTDQGAGKCDALGLSAGEGGRPGPGVAFQADFGQRSEPVRGAAARQPDRHVGENLLRRDEAGFLEDDGARLGNEYLSLVGGVEGSEDPQQSRLPAAAGPEQCDELSPGDVESEIVQHSPGAEDAAQPSYPYGGSGCRIGHRVAP